MLSLIGGIILKYNRKFSFSSLSTAAGFVMGRAANGWREWKNTDGKTIDEIERNSLEK